MEKSWDIQLVNLTVGYGETIILKDITGSIPAGKITVILGGSGCGKSTLLRHVIGLSQPMSGKIIVGGLDIFAIKQKVFRRIRRRMGVLFQDGALLGSLTVAENVGLPLREHTNIQQNIIHKVAVAKLGLVGLAPFSEYYPSELSGGMRKRAGLARAMVADPPILLCDEPTSGLDPISAAQMDELLLSMKRQFPEMTIVVVSHDLASLQTIADHVLVLHEKSLLYCGDLAGLNASDNPYLKQFLKRQAGQTRAVEGGKDDGRSTLGAAERENSGLSQEVWKQVRESLEQWSDDSDA